MKREKRKKTNNISNQCIQKLQQRVLFVPLQSCILYLFIRFQNDWAWIHKHIRAHTLLFCVRVIQKLFHDFWIYWNVIQRSDQKWVEQVKIQLSIYVSVKRRRLSAWWWWWPSSSLPLHHYIGNWNNLGYLSINLSFKIFSAGRNHTPLMRPACRKRIFCVQINWAFV